MIGESGRGVVRNLYNSVCNVFRPTKRIMKSQKELPRAAQSHDFECAAAAVLALALARSFIPRSRRPPPLSVFLAEHRNLCEDELERKK